MMKKILFSALAMLVFCSTNAFSQLTFSVNPGFELNGASVGYTFGNLIPYAGLQVFNGNIGYTDTYKEYDYMLDKVKEYKDESDLSGTIFMPFAGLKYMFSKQGDIRPYVNGTVFFPFFLASAEHNGKSDKNVDEFLDNFSAWGLEFGFGTEYFFAKNFSISGEFGLRILLASESAESDHEYYDPDEGEYKMDVRKMDVDLNLNATYSRIGLNFYFD